MRLSDEAKYKTGTQNNHAWPDRCNIQSGGIARVAVTAFKELVKAKMGSETSNMEEIIQCKAINAFFKKIINHIKISMKLNPAEISEHQEFLKSMMIKLEQNLLETTLGDPDEAVYVNNQFVSSVA